MALCVMQFATGLLVSSWVSRTPEIRDALHATTAVMGLVLTGLSVGSMAGVLCSARLVRRFGGWTVMVGGSGCSLTGVTAVAIGSATGSSVCVFLGLALCGWGYGSQEVALNIEASSIERLIGRPVLPAVHGSFSLGTVVGALAGIGAVAALVPVQWHLAVTVATAALAVGSTARWIPKGTGRDSVRPVRGARHHDSGRSRIWGDRALVCVAFFVLAIALAEGSAYDWLPLIFVDGYGFEPLYGSVMFAVFATAMTVGRFSGSYILMRCGRVTVMRGCVCATLVGLVAVVLAPGPHVAGFAVVLWAIGAALGIPVAMSAASDDPRNAVARVGALASAAYAAFLVGPPVLGLVGQHSGLREAMLIVVAALVVAGVATVGVPRASLARPAQFVDERCTCGGEETGGPR